MGAIVAWAVLRDDEFEIEIVSINFQFENFVSQSIQKGFPGDLSCDRSLLMRDARRKKRRDKTTRSEKHAKTNQFLPLPLVCTRSAVQ
jgi:hypothetical protein